MRKRHGKLTELVEDVKVLLASVQPARYGADASLFAVCRNYLPPSQRVLVMAPALLDDQAARMAAKVQSLGDEETRSVMVQEYRLSRYEAACFVRDSRAFRVYERS